MELRHLRYFVAVAEAAHMGRAATALRVAQSALSRQLQDLEREVGATLFDRHPRGVRLTAAGEAFLGEARASLAHAAAAAGAARAAAAGEVGRLRVGPPDFGARAGLAAAALAEFRARRPRVTVELVPLPWTAHVEALVADRLDVGFAIGAGVGDYPEGLAAAAVGLEPLAWALLPAGHPLAGGRDGRAGGAGGGAADGALGARGHPGHPRPRDRGARARRPRAAGGVVAAGVGVGGAAGGGGCGVVCGGRGRGRPAPPGTAAVRVPELADEVALELHVVWRRDAGAAAEYAACVQAQAAAGPRPRCRRAPRGTRRRGRPTRRPTRPPTRTQAPNAVAASGGTRPPPGRRRRPAGAPGGAHPQAGCPGASGTQPVQRPGTRT
jgi:DNA-binding transcriptional LysR family regulator